MEMGTVTQRVGLAWRRAVGEFVRGGRSFCQGHREGQCWVGMAHLCTMTSPHYPGGIRGRLLPWSLGGSVS